MANQKGSPIVRTVKKVIIFAVVVILLLFGFRFAMDKLYPLEYEQYVSKYASAYNVDEALVYAVIKTESNFDENAVSNKDAKGLMQIQKDTFEWTMTKMGVDGYLHTYNEVFDPEVNIKYGTYLLSLLLKEYDGDESTTLAAYNAGRGTVGDWLKTASSSDGKKLDAIPSESVSSYVNKVLRNKDIYEKRIK